MKAATLRQLRVFVSAASHLSFARAAAELHLTAPAVSLQIAELERHAGSPLFERLGRRVYLTPAGQSVLRAATAVLAQLRSLEEELASQRGVDGGLLDVGVISAGDYFFPQLLAAFCARHKGVRVQLSVSNREELLNRLDHNQVDLGILGKPPEGSDFDAVAFAQHPIVLIAAPGHALAGRRRVPLARLAGEGFIAREQGSLTREAMDETLARARIRPNVVIEAASNETIKQAVAAGFGIAFASLHAIGLEVEARRLAILDVTGFPVRRRWYAVHRRGKHLPAVARAFSAFLAEEGEHRIRRQLPRALAKMYA
ncbi:MAG TPA: LysR substrate-binding domain-containing protein [Usitatibacter sp.]|nr:LysR substrate-binding domain-containing protein [Usitatibacter sp.]